MVHPAFSPVLGQLPAVELLSRAIAHNRIAPGYLFVGPSGVGKRLTAECFVGALMQMGLPSQITQSSCSAISEQLKQRIQHRNHPDLLWVEPTYIHQGKRLSSVEAEAKGLKRRAPPILRLEQIREISEFLGRPPLEASQSVVVLDQTETMAESAANALLKTLEEPGQATLILIAPNIDSLLPTLISRCQVIPFRRLNGETIAQILQHVDHATILDHPPILNLAQGSPGEAITSWQQLQALEQQAPSLLASLQQPPTSIQQALTLAQTIAKQLDIEAQLWLVGYLQQSYWQNAYSQSFADHKLWAIAVEILETARHHLNRYVQPRLVWEVCLMKLVVS